MFNTLKLSGFLLYFGLIGALVSPLLHQGCVINENRNGSCREPKDCPQETIAKEGLNPKFCETPMGPSSKVCCPIESVSDSPSLNLNPAVSIVVEEPSVNIDCGNKGVVDHPNVVGDHASVNEWPWMALLVRRNRFDPLQIEFYCNGVLINDQYVLTAAYCVQIESSYFVRLGEHDFESFGVGANHINFAVAKTSIHPQYRENQAYHDLALLKLVGTIPMKLGISPICLPSETISSADITGKLGITAGWITDLNSGALSPILAEIVTQVSDSVVCNRIHSSNPIISESYFPEGLRFDSVLCTERSEEGRGSCQQALGAPFMHQDLEKGKWILGGINTGIGCGTKESPAIYTSLTNLTTASWIREIAFV